MISMIVAVAKNGVIGKDGKMPWHIPEDLAWFKEKTMGKKVLMGRKTMESIGGLLPGRENVILSTLAEDGEGYKVIRDPDDIITLGDVMVIGGEALYRRYLPLADRLYITRVLEEYDGDTFFPKIDPTEWVTVLEKKAYSKPKIIFTILERK